MSKNNQVIKVNGDNLPELWEKLRGKGGFVRPFLKAFRELVLGSLWEKDLTAKETETLKEILEQLNSGISTLSMGVAEIGLLGKVEEGSSPGENLSGELLCEIGCILDEFSSVQHEIALLYDKHIESLAGKKGGQS